VNTRLPRYSGSTSSSRPVEEAPPPPPSKSTRRVSAQEKRDAPLPPPPPPAPLDENDDYEIVNTPTPTTETIADTTTNTVLSRLRGVSIVSDVQSQYSVESQQVGYRPRPRGTRDGNCSIGSLEETFGVLISLSCSEGSNTRTK